MWITQNSNTSSLFVDLSKKTLPNGLKISWCCIIIEDLYPVSKFPKIYEYKSPCSINMKPWTLPVQLYRIIFEADSFKCVWLSTRLYRTCVTIVHVFSFKYKFDILNQSRACLRNDVSFLLFPRPTIQISKDYFFKTLFEFSIII